MVMANIAAFVALQYYRRKRLEEGCRKCKQFRGWKEKCGNGKIPEYKYDDCPTNPEL